MWPRGICSRLRGKDPERGTSCRIRAFLKAPSSMASGEAIRLLDMTAVPAAWPLETVLLTSSPTKAWCEWMLGGTIPLGLASQRLAQRLTAMAREELQKVKEEKVHLARRLQEPNLAAQLLQRGQAELPRCVVCSFTNEGLVRWNDGLNFLLGLAGRCCSVPGPNTLEL